MDGGRSRKMPVAGQPKVTQANKSRNRGQSQLEVGVFKAEKRQSGGWRVETEMIRHSVHTRHSILPHNHVAVHSSRGLAMSYGRVFYRTCPEFLALILETLESMRSKPISKY